MFNMKLIYSRYLTSILTAAALTSSMQVYAGVANGFDYLVMPPSGHSLPEGCSFGRAFQSNIDEAEITLDDVQDAYSASKDLWDEADWGQDTWNGDDQLQYDWEQSSWNENDWVDTSNDDKQTTYENLKDAGTIAKAGYAFYQLWESSDYLKIEGPEHVIQGQYHRFKGNLFDIYANVRFYTNEAGYVGKDKSNWEANSYLNLKFDREWGKGVVWIARDGLCSAKAVWVQKHPKIDLVVHPNRTATVSYFVDRFSKSYLKRSPIQVSVTQSGNDLGSFVIPAGKQVGTHTITNFSYGNDVSVIANFSDGTYTAEDSHFQSTPTARRNSGACAAACPSSLGWYQSQCKGLSSVCN